MIRQALGEAAHARAGAFVSRHPLLRHLIAGSGDPRIAELPFYVADTPANELDLVVFRGSAEAGRRRAAWPIGVMAVHSQQYLDEPKAPDNGGSRLAVAFAVGNFMLVGEVPGPDRHAWANNPEIGMGVGPEDLHAAPVIWRADNTLFIPEHGFRIDGTKDALGRVSPQYKNAAATPDSVLLY